MSTQIITRNLTPPGVTTGADINKNAALTATEFDQNLINLRAAVDGKSPLAGPGSSQAFTTGALTATHGTFSDAVEYGVDITGALLASGKYYSGVVIGTAPTSNQRIGIGMVYDSGAPSSSYFHITPYGGTEGSIFKIINSSGNVLIGTTIDNASTALLQVNGLISTTGVITTRTNTTVPNTTATTVLALTDGFYQVFARITAIPPTTHSAVGFISVHNGSAKLVSTTTVGVLALSISGSNLQVTQSIGSAQEVWISAVKMPL